MAFDQGAEGVAVAFDAERVRQRQRHLAAGAMGGGGGGVEGGLGFRWVEQIAFQGGDGAVGDAGFIHIGRAEGDAGAEEGVHGALAVRGDQDEAARGGGGAHQRGGGEMHPGGGDVVAEHGAELVIGDLAEISHLGAEGGGHRAGIAGGAAADFLGRRHGGIQGFRRCGVDQRHGAFVHGVGGQEIVRHRGDDVDNGIADAQDIETRLDHDPTPCGKGARLSSGGAVGNLGARRWT